MGELLDNDQGPEPAAIVATARREDLIDWLWEIAARVRRGEVAIERALLAAMWAGQQREAAAWTELQLAHQRPLVDVGNPATKKL